MVTKKEKLYVYCFQRGIGPEPPFLAEVISISRTSYMLKVGRKNIEVVRPACSSTPYTQADLDKFQQGGAAAGVAPEGQPVVKDDFVQKAQKPSGMAKGFFG